MHYEYACSRTDTARRADVRVQASRGHVVKEGSCGWLAQARLAVQRPHHRSDRGPGARHGTRTLRIGDVPLEPEPGRLRAAGRDRHRGQGLRRLGPVRRPGLPGPGANAIGAGQVREDLRPLGHEPRRLQSPGGRQRRRPVDLYLDALRREQRQDPGAHPLGGREHRPGNDALRGRPRRRGVAGRDRRQRQRGRGLDALRRHEPAERGTEPSARSCSSHPPGSMPSVPRSR